MKTGKKSLKCYQCNQNNGCHDGFLIAKVCYPFHTCIKCKNIVEIVSIILPILGFLQFDSLHNPMWGGNCPPRSQQQYPYNTPLCLLCLRELQVVLVTNSVLLQCSTQWCIHISLPWCSSFTTHGNHLSFQPHCFLTKAVTKRRLNLRMKAMRTRVKPTHPHPHPLPHNLQRNQSHLENISHERKAQKMKYKLVTNDCNVGNTI